MVYGLFVLSAFFVNSKNLPARILGHDDDK